MRGKYNNKRILRVMLFACIFQEFSGRRLINTDKIYGPKKERAKWVTHDIGSVYLYSRYIRIKNKTRETACWVEYEIVRIQRHILKSHINL